MATDVIYPSPPQNEKAFKEIPNRCTFLGGLCHPNNRVLYYKIAGVLVRAFDLEAMNATGETPIFGYEPVDIEITVKPISK